MNLAKVTSKQLACFHIFPTLSTYFKKNVMLRNLKQIRGLSSVAAANSFKLDFNNQKLKKYLESLRQEFYELRVSNSANAYDQLRMKKLNGIVQSLEQHNVLQKNMITKADIENEKDDDMRQLIEEENEVYKDLLLKTEDQLLNQVLTLTDDKYYPSLIFEVNAGAGGQEAMLFAKELFEMYTNYFEYNGWEYEILTEDSTDLGGLRHANVILRDPEAYNTLQFEAGVHRVQRIPATEKSGRVHTSTASVTIIPQSADVDITINEKDLKIETKRASGAGGQHVNTTDSAVRAVHLPTGIAVECQSERSQLKNRQIAVRRLQAKLVLQQSERIEKDNKSTRKLQQGNLNRNEKIRTYNFAQDRITDHRITGGTVHNIQEFLQGNAHLEDLMKRLVLENRKALLAEMTAYDDLPTKRDNKRKN